MEISAFEFKDLLKSYFNNRIKVLSAKCKLCIKNKSTHAEKWLLSVILLYIITDALMYKQHFKVVAG